MESSMHHMDWFWLGAARRGTQRTIVLVLWIITGWAPLASAEEDSQWNSGFYRVEPEKTPFKVRPAQPRRDYEEDDRSIPWREGRREEAPPMSGAMRGPGRGWNEGARGSSRPWGRVPSQWEDPGYAHGGGSGQRNELDERYSSPVGERWGDGYGRDQDPNRLGYRDYPPDRGGYSRWDGPYQRNDGRGGYRSGEDPSRERGGYEERYPRAGGYEEERPRSEGNWWGRGSGSSGGRYWPEER
ncbi:MAG: hypothetical protein HQL86_00080 [Magnetococcales bacterium]|nr:hypothetical protein [Magnetococcales bacterium]